MKEKVHVKPAIDELYPVLFLQRTQDKSQPSIDSELFDKYCEAFDSFNRISSEIAEVLKSQGAL